MRELLDHPLVVLGRIMPASNHTFLTQLGDTGLQCVYKPQSGERPLWDFTDGTLAAREYAAWLVSDHLGWDIVPPTVLRDGPAGPGMVQLWMEVEEPAAGTRELPDPVDVVPVGSMPPGFLHVVDASGPGDEPVMLVHEDSVPLRRMAVFDLITNNTDRKGGHVLPMRGGHRYGVDHGVCFHTDDKLRTVLWGFHGRAVPEPDLMALKGIDLGILSRLLSTSELAAIADRIARLQLFPDPPGDRYAIPWPPI